MIHIEYHKENVDKFYEKSGMKIAKFKDLPYSKRRGKDRQNR